MGWIDSPKTKAVYGFVGKEGEILLNDVKVEVKTDFATVAISSLTDEPIKSSGNMLLTAVGRAENTNSKYNEDRTAVSYTHLDVYKRQRISFTRVGQRKA